MTDRSVSVPAGWEHTGDTRYRFSTTSGTVVVEVVERRSEYQLRASVMDDEALVSRNDFLVTRCDDQDAAAKGAIDFVETLDAELVDRGDRTLSRLVDESAESFDTGGFWIFD